MPVHSISCSDGDEDFKMQIGGAWIDTQDLPGKFNKQFRKTFGQTTRLKTDEVEKYLAMESEFWDDWQWPQELLKKRYPDAFTMACIEFAGDLSDERIYKLLRNEESDSEDKLEFVLKALIGLKDIRAKDLAIKVAKSEGFRNLWQDVFEYLATIQSEEVEDFFIDFLVNDEKMRPKLTQIADEYLAGRGENK
jgi:hypothetical protein